MQSKTSFFNKTIFKKNLTRFAPVWVVYTLCLVLGVVLMYSNGDRQVSYWFANHMTEMPDVMNVVNLGYALLVAQLLFGDLFNSRMCNALHALPVRRENWFLTNLVSGLVFSLVPTLVMALVATPLLMGSLFENAWHLAWWIFLCANLEFVCYFGIAVFAAMCVGSRFTMVAGYALVNFGAYVCYWLVNTVYTPMLYGVITPGYLADSLTPFVQVANPSYFEMGSYSELLEQFGDALEGASAVFTLTDEWWRLWVLAGAGMVFAALALVLYRKRDLECAGDAVAFRLLVPVFQVLCSVCVATMSQFFLHMYLGLDSRNMLVLWTGLVVGWFIGKMLVERSTRVFTLHNCKGLAVLAAVLAVSLWMTHVDILGIETRLPDREKIKSVSLGSNWTSDVELEDPEDIDAMLRLQALALEERAESDGIYVLGTNGEWVEYIDNNSHLYDKETVNEQEHRYVPSISLYYTMENGRQVRRHYNVWTDSAAGEIAKHYLSRWDSVNNRTTTIGDKEVKRLDLVMDTFENFTVDSFPANSRDLPAILKDKQKAEELLEVLRKDAAAGNLAQHPYFHTGYFRYEVDYNETGYEETNNVYLRFGGKEKSWSVEIYPDCEHTIQWLKENGLMTWEICEGSPRIW